MQVYEFHNIRNNTQSKWSRFFVAFSLSEAIRYAKEWEEIVNEATDSDDKKFTFDYENVIIADIEKVPEKVGYIEYEQESGL